jgi:small subunit ribosomal protein S6
MPLYEHVYMARQDVTAQQVEAMTDLLKGIIEGNGGTIGKAEYWGVKTLAYRIKKNRKAHFTLLNIDAPAAAVAEMERQMGINEDILRFMTVRVEELEEGPSAMLQKRDRDDRDERGDRFGGGGGRFGGGGGGRFGGGGGAGGGGNRFGDRERGPRPDRPRRDEAPAAVEEAI